MRITVQIHDVDHEVDIEPEDLPYPYSHAESLKSVLETILKEPTLQAEGLTINGEYTMLTDLILEVLA